jgi:lipopolysaccharide/colanic/teichoic acid biosynthesis glycosyltransferase
MPAKTRSHHAEPRVMQSSLPQSVPSGSLTRRGWYASAKRAFDLIVSVLLCTVALPLILLSVFLVKLTSRGPVFYTQIRLGLNGQPFRIYKIRSMVVDSEKGGACWSKPGDPRVTWIGRILRRTHLDELPQLWNVLCGDMSLVGPRPERPEFVPSLEQAIPRYRDRLQVRPGLTGLAQVQLPPDTDLESVRRKLACDLYYIRHLSMWLDIRLIFVTAFYLIGQSCRLPCRLLRIPGGDLVETHYERLVRERDQQSPPAPSSSGEVAPVRVETQTV